MKIEYGPPAPQGVKQLAYLGDIPGGSSLGGLAALGIAAYSLTKKGQERKNTLLLAGGVWLASMLL